MTIASSSRSCASVRATSGARCWSKCGAVRSTKVWDLESAKPVTNLEPYPSIMQLFDRAVEQRSQGGNVSVAYDRAVGFPVRLEIGTIANDAGTVYMLGELTKL